MYSCHLFLISSASVRSLSFLFFIVPIFAWNIPLVSLIFLRSSLIFPSLFISLYFFVLLLKKDFLSPLVTLELCLQIGISFPFSFSFASFLRYLLVLLDIHFAFLHFCFLGRFWLLPLVQCYKSSIFLQAHCLSDLILWIYLSPMLYNHKWFDLDHTWMV